MLTTDQLQALKADILADPVLAAQPMNDDGHAAIRDAYNLIASPVWRVWRTSVSTAEVKDAVNWTEYIGRSVGERSAFELMIANHVINPARANVRQGISDIFSGTQGQVTRTALLALAKRDATRAEKLFSTGTGSDAVPATMTFEGSLSYSDVSAARNS
jgi:hypothetical protein